MAYRFIGLIYKCKVDNFLLFIPFLLFPFLDYEINGEKFSSEAFKNMYLNITPTDDENNNLFSTSFEKLSETMTDISGDGGVMKKLLKPGEGVTVPEEAIVRSKFWFNQ